MNYRNFSYLCRNYLLTNMHLPDTKSMALRMNYSDEQYTSLNVRDLGGGYCAILILSLFSHIHVSDARQGHLRICRTSSDNQNPI